MTSVQYTLVGTEDGESIVVFVAGEAPQVAQDSHPNFAQIVTRAKAQDPTVVELFDIAATVTQKFERLSERVTTAHGRLYLDGEEVDNALTQQVLRFMDEGIDDFRPLVAFFENVQANPNEHSREMLYSWLAGRNFTITPLGMIVGYKAVRERDGEFVSIHGGKAIVDGEVKTGSIPNRIGSVIEMPRGDVQFDPSVGCHTGLHVGTYDYAENFGGSGPMLEVHVNPRDVVSVPTDCDAQKMRTCRYVVVDQIEAAYTSPLLYDYEDDYDGWGELDDEPEDSRDYEPRWY